MWYAAAAPALTCPTNPGASKASCRTTWRGRLWAASNCKKRDRQIWTRGPSATWTHIFSKQYCKIFGKCYHLTMLPWKSHLSIFWEITFSSRRSPWILFEKRCRAINYRRGKAIGDQLGNVYRKQEIKGKVVGFVDFWADEAQIEKTSSLIAKNTTCFFFKDTFSDMFSFLQVRIPPFFLWSRKPLTCEASLDSLHSRTCTFQLLAFGQKLGFCMGRGWGSEQGQLTLPS